MTYLINNKLINPINFTNDELSSPFSFSLVTSFSRSLKPKTTSTKGIFPCFLFVFEDTGLKVPNFSLKKSNDELEDV